MRKVLAALTLCCSTPTFTAEFDVAHIREQGQDMIIIPLASSFGYKAPKARDEIIYGLQLCASNAGLAGEVVPVWLSPYDSGKLMFVAPNQWYSFFRNIDIDWVTENINKTLTCR